MNKPNIQHFKFLSGPLSFYTLTYIILIRLLPHKSYSHFDRNVVMGIPIELKPKDQGIIMGEYVTEFGWTNRITTKTGF